MTLLAGTHEDQELLGAELTLTSDHARTRELDLHSAPRSPGRHLTSSGHQLGRTEVTMERGEQELTRRGSGRGDRPAHGHTPGGGGRVVGHLQSLTLGAGGCILDHTGRGGGGGTYWQPGNPAIIEIKNILRIYTGAFLSNMRMSIVIICSKVGKITSRNYTFRDNIKFPLACLLT